MIGSFKYFIDQDINDSLNKTDNSISSYQFQRIQKLVLNRFYGGSYPPGLIKMYFFQADVFLKLDSPSKQFQRLWYFGLVKQQGWQQQYRRDCFFRTS